jgi:hypothetical protein
VAFREGVEWGPLLVIAAPCSAGFGLLMALWMWRTEEADYRHTPPPDSRRE